MIVGHIVTLIISCLILQILSSPTYILEDETLYFEKLAAKYGHPPEKYDVITEDGFVLTLYHIPGDGKSKTPVLLTHGILCSADTWILRGNTSIPITLANAGYDVWLGNTRGNRYSRRHLNLDPNLDNSFWNFTFHEQAIYDLAAIIDTVLDKTGANKVNAVAHSLGNTLYYVLASTKLEYNEKINILTALSPICYLHNTPEPIKTILNLSSRFEDISRQEIFGDGFLLNGFRLLCTLPVFAYEICIQSIIFWLAGEDSEEIGPDFVPAVATYFPSSTSLRNLVHLGQIYNSENFAHYDYGAGKNVLMYNSSKPLMYDLDKVRMPVALISAKNDRMSTLSDVDILRSKLPNVVSDVVVPKENFNHVDYIWGANMNTYMHPYILSILEKYS